MVCTETYKEHIMYTFNAFCKVVIRYAAINAWRERNRRQKKEISLEYLTEEKFYPLNTLDRYFTAPYEEYPVTICNHTVIFTNGELATALQSLPEKKREIIFLYFSDIIRNKKSVNYMDVAEVQYGITCTVLCRFYKKKWRCFQMEKPNLVPYETIIKATKGEPEAVDEVLRHYNKRIRYASLENGHINIDTEDSIRQRLVAALFKFRFDC